MLFSALDTTEEEGKTEYKRLPDWVLLTFNVLFLVHVILAVIITCNAWHDEQYVYVWLSTSVFLLALLVLLLILFALNAYFVFYFYKVMIGCLIFFIPFIILSIIFPLICTIFCIEKMRKPTSSFYAKFWRKSCEYIIIYQLLFTIPHSLIYTLMLYDQTINNDLNSLMLSCMFFGELHLCISLLYFIHKRVNDSENATYSMEYRQMLSISHLLLWISVVLEIFMVNFFVFSVHLISLTSVIVWSVILFFSFPFSFAFFCFQYRRMNMTNQAPKYIEWAVINPLLIMRNDTHKGNEYQMIEQRIYCILHCLFHSNTSQTPRSPMQAQMTEIDCLLNDDSVPNNSLNSNNAIAFHKNGSDECLQCQIEQVDCDSDLKLLFPRKMSVYQKIKGYFGIRVNQYWKLICVCFWAICRILFYFFPLIVLIYCGQMEGHGGTQFFVVLLFIFYSLLLLFSLIILYLLYRIYDYIGYLVFGNHDIQNCGYLELWTKYKRNECIHRCMLNQKHITKCIVGYLQ